MCDTPLSGDEESVCRFCLPDLPVTRFHLTPDNRAEQLFFGKADIHRCACFCFYRKGDRFRELIHEFKYHDNRKAAYRIGLLYGKMLKNDGWHTPIDQIIPVPLHPLKRIKRGYNQSEWIARGIASVWNIPVLTRVLTKKKVTSTQTKKSLFERHLNTHDTFHTKAEALTDGMHILLVDDVLTSGSTLTACAISIQAAADEIGRAHV